jgi:hypothetical protein
MSVLSRRSAKPPQLTTFGDDGRAIIDVPPAAQNDAATGLGGGGVVAVNHVRDTNSAVLREAAALGGADFDDTTPFWRRRPARWGPAQRFQATQAFLALANALAVVGVLSNAHNRTGFALTHALTRPVPWRPERADDMPKILVTTELPQRMLNARVMATWTFALGVAANTLPLVTHRVRAWCYESLVQKTMPARTLDITFGLGVCAMMLTAQAGVRDAATVACAAACTAAFAACVLAAQHALFYACVLSSHGARSKSRGEISVSLLAATAVATAGCVPAVARAAMGSDMNEYDMHAVYAAAGLVLAYALVALVSTAHTCELVSDIATDAMLGALAFVVRSVTFATVPMIELNAEVMPTAPPAPAGV